MSEQRHALKDGRFVCRLHPVNHLEHFWRYWDDPKVAFSFVSYLKALGWSVTRDDVDDLTNLLHQSDVVICAWSTLVLEAMVMDNPTIVPAFSPIQRDGARLHMEIAFRLNYRSFVKNGWIPIAQSPEELKEMINGALRDRSWRQEDRRAAVELRVPFRDEKSSRRVTEFLLPAMEK